MSALTSADVAAMVDRFALLMPAPLVAAWPTSYEAKRVERLALGAPEEYGGLNRLCTAIATCVSDFERRMAAEELNARRAAEAEKRSPPSIQAPETPTGMGYRTCSVCRGTLKEGCGEPCRCTKYGGHPGWELYAVVAR